MFINMAWKAFIKRKTLFIANTSRHNVMKLDLNLFKIYYDLISKYEKIFV
jgi:hypothetical protein